MPLIFIFFTCWYQPTLGIFFLKQSLYKSSKNQPECKIRYKLISCCISDQFQLEMVVLKVLREFAAGTSIHGFKFLESPKSSSRTKIIWAIAIVVALTYASWEMRNSVISKYYCVFGAVLDLLPLLFYRLHYLLFIHKLLF